jgi:CheY-like chemotaxis protein
MNEGEDAMAFIERIMLVDDNEADNVYHELILRAAGFTGDLWIHETGEAALEQLRGAGMRAPCLILLDINMPGMDGFEFAAAAAPLLKRHPALIVVMLTSSSSPEDYSRAIEMEQVSSYLIKPLTVSSAFTLIVGGASPGRH